MSNVRGRFTIPLPGLSTFPELNVRTYVSVGGKPGVWLFSLDAETTLAVKVASWGFGPPYHRASMVAVRQDGGIAYRSRRWGARKGRIASRRSIGPADRQPPLPSPTASNTGSPSATASGASGAVHSIAARSTMPPGRSRRERWRWLRR